MLKQITPSEAVEILLAQSVRLQREDVQLWDAWGRVLAEDMKAVYPAPPFDRSPYDGYALRSSDTAGASDSTPVTLRITEEIAAGVIPAREVGPGQAAKVLTGAPVPRGADCVVKYELTRFTASTVTLSSPFFPGNIVRAGEDISAGAAAAVQGTVMNSGILGILAGQGYALLPAWKRPRIAVLSTGSELVEAGRPLPPGKIYSTNFHTLSGILREAGAVPENAGIVPDEPAAIADRICRGIEGADMVLMTGGASVGDYDFTLRALELAGGKILFQRVRCRPGGAMLAGMVGEKLVLCLSGNPGAAAAGLLRVGMAYIRKLCGRKDVYPSQMQVILRRPYEKPSPQFRLVWGRLLVEDGGAYFDAGEGQNSSGISSLAHCDLLAEIPAGTPPLAAGALVTAYRING